MYKLLIHQWKEKIRSPFWQKSIGLNIVLGILGLYVMLNILAIGYFADKIIHEIYPDRDMVEAFTGLLFYFFAFDLIFRFLFQQLPTLSIQPYLTLPIRKSTLLHYPLLKTVPDIFNLLALLLILPFFIKIICTTHTLIFSIVWIITVLSLIVTNNYLNFSLKKYFSKRPLLILLLLFITGSFIYLEITKVISIAGVFSEAILYQANMPFLVIIPIAIAILAYELAYFLLKRNSYIEDSQNSKRANARSFLFLNHFGETGNLMRVEVKMILRNKRPKSLLYISLIFLLYGFIFYQQKYLDNYMILIFIGFFLTSMFAINYGQFFFSWESSFFECYIVNQIPVLRYIRSKYLFFTLICFVSFIVTLPYALISYKIALINASLLVYNIGISSFMMMFFCTFNTSRIDLGRSQFMNYQGTGVTQFLAVIPIMGFPFLIYFVFLILGIPEYSFFAIGIIGITAIAFNKYLLQMVANQLVNRKYKMAAGFRQK